MPTDQELKNIVKETYGEIASQSKKANQACCCGSGTVDLKMDYSIMADDYKDVDGYVEDADLGLGCGLPTEYAKMTPGDTVLDLGSGAGNDAFIARQVVGKEGKVIGLDMTEEMIDKARINCEKTKFNNVEFRFGEIEAMPVVDSSVDVVISNCVLNLVPNKDKAFAEIKRVLKPTGHFSVSDIVLNGDLPKKLRGAAEMYAGCVAGALMQEEYVGIINELGFKNVQIQKDKQIVIPDHILKEYLNDAEIEDYKKQTNLIKSITVYADNA
jgi:arsenite methyltransferase